MVHDDPAKTGDEQGPAARPAQAEDAGTTRPRAPLMSVVLRQVGTLAGGALMAQATWGTPWFVAVVAAVVLVEGLIVWDARHPRRA